MLALPSGTATAAPRRDATIASATAVFGVAVAMVFAGLIAAYLSLRTEVRPFPPEGVEFDFYLVRTLAITVLMASVTVEWAAYALRKGYRGHALVAYGITLALGVATFTGIWYLLTARFEFGLVETPYATVVYATIFAAFLAAVGGALFVFLTLLRAAGNQVPEGPSPLARATAVGWHVAAAAWIVAYYIVFVTK